MNIALLTCEKFPNLYEADQPLIPELAKHDITAEATVWDDPTIDWLQFDFLIFRNTWDYYEKEAAFNLWLDRIEALKIPTLNAFEIIKANKHKFYLRDLEAQGIGIIPTIFIDKTDALNLRDLIPPHWQKMIIKPAFSAGSYQTGAFSLVDIDSINEKYKPIAASKELLLQEFMPEIQALGETSLIFFNKKFSHAVNKKPADGDFRIQVQFGGKYALINPNPELIEQAQNIVNTFLYPLLYARVDGIVINNKLHLMEVECIEPDLYFNIHQNARKTFVNSILELTAR